MRSAILAFTILAGCGGDEGPGYPECPAGKFLLEGAVDGMPVMIDETANGGFSQLGTGQFEQGRPAVLKMTWEKTLYDGQSGPAMGTVVLPKGETLCAGAGSRVAFPANGDQIQFLLKNLASGSGCSVPKTGELRACWRSTR